MDLIIGERIAFSILLVIVIMDLIIGKEYRVCDIIRIFLYQILELPPIGILLAFAAECKDDR